MSETKLCPYCVEPIQAQAVFCKHCKKEIVQNPEKDQTKEKVSTFWERNKIWLPLVLILLVIFIYYLGTMNSKESRETDTNVNDETESSEEIEDEEKALQEDLPIEDVKTLGVSYDEMMLFLSGSFPMESSPLLDDTERYVGTAENGSILELTGSKDDLTRASIMLEVGNSDPEVINKLSTITIRFLNAAVPGWPDSNEWLNQTLLDLASGPIHEIESVYEDKVIKATFVPAAALVTIVVSPK